MIRRPPRSTLFPTRRSSDLAIASSANTHSSGSMSTLSVLERMKNTFAPKGPLRTRRRARGRIGGGAGGPNRPLFGEGEAVKHNPTPHLYSHLRLNTKQKPYE